MRDGLQTEGVLPRWNHHHGDRAPVRTLVHPGFQPGTEPGVEDLRVALPEFGVQSALDLEMIQLQLDDRNMLGEIPADVPCANVQTGDSACLALRFDHHTYLLLNVG